jgi:hypothetical protein
LAGTFAVGADILTCSRRIRLSHISGVQCWFVLGRCPILGLCHNCAHSSSELPDQRGNVEWVHRMTRSSAREVNTKHFSFGNLIERDGLGSHKTVRSDCALVYDRVLAQLQRWTTQIPEIRSLALLTDSVTRCRNERLKVFSWRRSLRAAHYHSGGSSWPVRTVTRRKRR